MRMMLKRDAVRTTNTSLYSARALQIGRRIFDGSRHHVHYVAIAVRQNDASRSSRDRIAKLILNMKSPPRNESDVIGRRRRVEESLVVDAIREVVPSKRTWIALSASVRFEC